MDFGLHCGHQLMTFFFWFSPMGAIFDVVGYLFLFFFLGFAANSTPGVVLALAKHPEFGCHTPLSSIYDKIHGKLIRIEFIMIVLE